MVDPTPVLNHLLFQGYGAAGGAGGGGMGGGGSALGFSLLHHPGERVEA